MEVHEVEGQSFKKILVGDICIKTLGKCVLGGDGACDTRCKQANKYWIGQCEADHICICSYWCPSTH